MMWWIYKLSLFNHCTVCEQKKPSVSYFAIVHRVCVCVCVRVWCVCVCVCVWIQCICKSIFYCILTILSWEWVTDTIENGFIKGKENCHWEKKREMRMLACWGCCDKTHRLRSYIHFLMIWKQGVQELVVLAEFVSAFLDGLLWLPGALRLHMHQEGKLNATLSWACKAPVCQTKVQQQCPDLTFITFS